MELVGYEEESGGRGEVPAVSGIWDEYESAMPEREDELRGVCEHTCDVHAREYAMLTSSKISLWSQIPER